MQVYKADLHVHTVLSPCGGLDMSPVNIVNKASNEGIQILGITDHNSTRHAPLIKSLGERKNIFVLCGAEVTSREEIHCLTFFENNDILADFQLYLEKHLIRVRNKPDLFGYQVVVDEQERVLEEIEPLLISAINQTIDEVENKVHELGGLFIPAHIDRPAYSLMSQLGFVPKGIAADALEIVNKNKQKELVEKFPHLADYTFVTNSDAHCLEQIGQRYNLICIETPSFDEIAMALRGENGRTVNGERRTENGEQ